MKRETIIRHIISFILTFVVGFALVLIIDIDNITLESFKDGTIAGIVFSALRGGVKAILELIINKYGRDISK